MQITIDLPSEIEQNLIRQAAQSNVSLQTLILQALRQLTQPKPSITSQWSEIILTYQGNPNFPAFEAYRHELLLTYEPEIL